MAPDASSFLTVWMTAVTDVPTSLAISRKLFRALALRTRMIFLSSSSIMGGTSNYRD